MLEQVLLACYFHAYLESEDTMPEMEYTAHFWQRHLCLQAKNDQGNLTFS